MQLTLVSMASSGTHSVSLPLYASDRDTECRDKCTARENKSTQRGKQQAE